MTEARSPEALMVGRMIRELRRYVGLSETAVGALLGAEPEEVEAWEAGRASMPPAALTALAEMFDVPLEILAQDLLEAVERQMAPNGAETRDEGAEKREDEDPAPATVEETLHRYRTRRIDRNEAYTRLLHTLVEHAREAEG